MLARWEADGAPTATELRPGLSWEEMDRLVEPLGLTLPPEARTLWGWRDGSSMKPGVEWMGKGWQPLPLGRAVSLTTEFRELWKDMPDVRVEDHWQPGFLVISRPDRAEVLAIDCHEVGEVSPVFFVDAYEAQPLGAAVAPSLGALMDLWLWSMNERLTHYDREAQRWRYEWERLPPGFP